MTKQADTIQAHGQVTLPFDFRKRYGLKKGDVIIFQETDKGLLIRPDASQQMSKLDELGAALRAQGITVDTLLASANTIRQKIYDEKYKNEG